MENKLQPIHPSLTLGREDTLKFNHNLELLVASHSLYSRCAGFSGTRVCVHKKVIQRKELKQKISFVP